MADPGIMRNSVPKSHIIDTLSFYQYLSILESSLGGKGRSEELENMMPWEQETSNARGTRNRQERNGIEVGSLH